MKPMDVALIGVCGYGEYYLNEFQMNRDLNAGVRAIVDPFAAASPHLP